MKIIKKVAILREELKAITGSSNLAIILNQLVYWSDGRISDYKDFISEENSRKDEIPIYGWIYKKAEELQEEIMGLSIKTIRKYLKQLEAMNFLYVRRNPRCKWDKTYQYRINLNFIYSQLIEKNYDLSGYELKNHYRPMWQNYPYGEVILPLQKGNITSAIAENTTEKTLHIYNNNSKKNSVYEEAEEKIKNHWEELGLQISNTIPSAKKILQSYSLEQILESISNYAEIKNSPLHFYDVNWRLSKFLLSDKGVGQFLSVNDPFSKLKDLKQKKEVKPKTNIFKPISEDYDSFNILNTDSQTFYGFSIPEIREPWNYIDDIKWELEVNRFTASSFWYLEASIAGLLFRKKNDNGKYSDKLEWLMETWKEKLPIYIRSEN